jgi:PAT family beta-lactamase induction signal transducer AmpG
VGLGAAGGPPADPGPDTGAGPRRSWLLLSQAAIIAGLVGMALADPRQTLGPIVWCALARGLRLGHAGHRAGRLPHRIGRPDRQAALAASYQTGYRLAMIWAGAGVLWIAARAEVAPAVAGLSGAAAYQNGAWQTAYLVMAASMLVGVVTVLLSREPAQVVLPPGAKMPPNGCAARWSSRLPTSSAATAGRRR